MAGEYIEKIVIQNFKCFNGKFELPLNKELNIIVGDNDAGKSTILEALHLTLTGLFHGKYLKHELTQYLFNNDLVKEYLAAINNPQSIKTAILPFIEIEVFFSTDSFPEFEGDKNSDKRKASGVSYKIAFDEKYKSEYNNLIDKLKESREELHTIPIEYYDIEWISFARNNITARAIPMKSALIDSTAYKYQNGSDMYIARIIKEFLGINDVVDIAQAHRKMKDGFRNDDAVAQINSKITEAVKISNKQVKLSVDLSAKNAWENSLVTYINDVPFHYVGKGEQCTVKTKLALSHNKTQEANILLVEEPENHLSHTTLNQLIYDIKTSNSEKQIIVSTHSSFVANKLGLSHLKLMHGTNLMEHANLPEETRNFFEKLSGYDTLRLLLCKKAILVEGDSDELIVQKAYRDKKQGRLPIEDGIDVISVGTSFLRFLEIAEKLKQPTVVVTDNDGDAEYLKEKYAHYLQNTQENNIKICFDEIVDPGNLKIGNKYFNYNTLEPKLVKANNNDLELFGRIFNKKFISIDALYKYMQNDKTGCALKIFDTKENIKFPKYIMDAIEDEQPR